MSTITYDDFNIHHTKTDTEIRSQILFDTSSGDIKVKTRQETCSELRTLIATRNQEPGSLSTLADSQTSTFGGLKRGEEWLRMPNKAIGYAKTCYKRCREAEAKVTDSRAVLASVTKIV